MSWPLNGLNFVGPSQSRGILPTVVPPVPQQPPSGPGPQTGTEPHFQGNGPVPWPAARGVPNGDYGKQNADPPALDPVYVAFPTALNFSVNNLLIPNNTPGTTVLSVMSVIMSDGSSYSGSYTWSDPLIDIAIPNLVVPLAGYTGADNGVYSMTVTVFGGPNSSITVTSTFYYAIGNP